MKSEKQKISSLQGFDASDDLKTAEAFQQSWNRVGVVYSRDQFLEWFHPLTPDDLKDKELLELGFGNGSLLVHAASAAPKRLAGVDLGDTIETARKLLAAFGFGDVELYRGDLARIDLGAFDITYCIGVLHHLNDPDEGFASVLRHTKPGGRFHCWVYAREGNLIIRLFVEPLRRVTCRLPWRITKYVVALPLVVPYFLVVKILNAIGAFRRDGVARRLPLFEYSRWISTRPFSFFHHVAFDQLVTPQTRYLSRKEIEDWLNSPLVDPDSVYLFFRNGNSWKFGGRRKQAAAQKGQSFS